MNKKNRNFEDILLTRAFEEYLRREDEKLPSDEELREEFPPREEECRKYSVMARRGERRFSAIKTLKWVAVIVLAAVSVSFAGLMMNENVRAAVFGVFVGRNGNGTKTRVSFLGDGFFEGKDMFDLTVGYVPEGLKTFELSKEYQEQVTQENVLRIIRERGSFSIDYRLLIRGKPRPVTLKAALFKEGGVEKLVVGVRAWKDRQIEV